MTKEKDRILVFVQQKADGHIDSITFELLKSATDLSLQGGETVCACILGSRVGLLADEISYYAGEVYVINDPFSLHVSARCLCIRPRRSLS